MTTEAAVRQEIEELRARGDDAAARERLKEWRTSKQASTKAAAKAATKTIKKRDADDGRWLSDVERSLLRFHLAASQRRGRLRASHRLPFVQCRQCDELRRETVAAKEQELHGEAPQS
jgi:hypothetical protein